MVAEPVDIARLRLAQERLDAYLKYSSEGVWMFESDRPIPVSLPTDEQVDLVLHHSVMRECNEQMARMYGVGSAADLLGMRIVDFIGDSPGSRALLASFVAADYKLRDVETQEADRQGVLHFFSNAATGVVENGILTRAWGTQLDITLRKKVERDLQEARDRLDIALSASDLGIWDYDPVSGHMTWDERARDICAVHPARPITYDNVVAAIHPADRCRVLALVQQSLNKSSGGSYATEYRVLGDDGQERWVSVRGRAYFDRKGRPSRFIGTMRDVTEQHEEHSRMEALMLENTRLLGEARAALATREDFLSTASHELRTPLTALHVRLGLVENGAVANESFIRFMRRQVDRLARLVRELVEVSEMEAGHLPIAPTEVDLAQVVRSTLDHMGDEASRAGTHLQLNAPPEGVAAMADPTYTAEAVENLLSNAIKYGCGQPVEVDVSADGDTAEVSVHDHGIGIPPEETGNLFERFARATPARNYGGLGLGLYIVRRIAEAHGGTVSMESDPSSGTVFRLRLPRAHGGHSHL